VDRSIESATDFVRTNVTGTQVLLDAARASGVERFVHVSTDEVYGSLGPEGLFTETTPLAPNSPYSASKAGSDLLVRSYVQTYGFPALITRCSNNYGPYQFPEKAIPLWTTNAMAEQTLPLYGDGKNVRDWIYVTDHCDALLAVMDRGRVGEVYNIGGECEKANVEIVETILDALGKPRSLIQLVQDRPGHDRRYAMDIQKIRDELGWSPSVRFEDGIRQTIEWYQGNREWWEDIKSGDYRDYYDRMYGDRLRASSEG
jgi:dTDP-glucose 4,6-dehydratase